MDKFKEIRPIVLGLAIRNGKVLVSEGYDKVKNQTFYRCLGGGIEFLEKSDVALKREFMEEIGANVSVKDLLGVFENIFTFNGKQAHELVFVYSVVLNDYDFKDEYSILDLPGHFAKWIDVNVFKRNEDILYPTEVVELL